MKLINNLKKIQEKISEISRGRPIALIVVSKGQSVNAIQELYQAGCFDFGENRVQEAIEKKPLCPPDIRWHFIGKLQRNKVNKIIGSFALIHSVDTTELAKKISALSVEKKVTTSILLEVKTSHEQTKGGLTPEELESVFSELIKLEGIDIQGLMTIAPLTTDEKMIRECFSNLRKLKEKLSYIKPLKHLSMGMSEDFPIAIEEGATMLRIGTKIFQYT